MIPNAVMMIISAVSNRCVFAYATTSGATGRTRSSLETVPGFRLAPNGLGIVLADGLCSDGDGPTMIAGLIAGLTAVAEGLVVFGVDGLDGATPEIVLGGEWLGSGLWLG